MAKVCDAFSVESSHRNQILEFEQPDRAGSGERLSLTFTAQNISDSRYLIDNANTFGGTHWNYPRQFTGALRYRFHF